MKKKVLLKSSCFIFGILILLGFGYKDEKDTNQVPMSAVSENAVEASVSKNTVEVTVSENVSEISAGINATEISAEINAAEINATEISTEKPVSDVKEFYEIFDWESIKQALFSVFYDDKEIVDANSRINTGNIQVEYEGEFPEELVEAFAELLYQNNITGNNMNDNDAYHDLLKKYGSEEYLLTVEDWVELYPEAKEHIEEIDSLYDIYKLCDIEQLKRCWKISRFYSKDNREYYIYISEGGSSGNCWADIMEKKGNEIVSAEGHFHMQGGDTGSVIYYEGEYYYVFTEYNYRLKYRDGIRIYRLNSEHLKTDNVLIRCIPEEFEWSEDFISSEEIKEELSAYVEQIKDEIMDSKYIERGDTRSGFYDFREDDSEVVTESRNVKRGDGSEAVPEIPLTREDEYYYPCQRIDFANVGVPIYFYKKVSQPERRKPYFIGEFYLYDESGHNVFRLSKEPETTWSDYKPVLVQMWFHEIDGKVYTFEMFHLKGYNYMMSVRLVEGNSITFVGQYFVAPRFCNEITEGGISGAG